MSKSPIQRVHVDRYLIAEILSNRSIVDAVDQVGSSIKDIPNSEPMLAKVLGQIFEQIPAQRGSVLLAGPHTKDLEPAAFRGNPFEVNSKIATPAFREQTAILADNVLCVPVWLYGSNLGVIYLDCGKGKTFTTYHLHLLIAIAREIASPLYNMRRIHTLQVENDQLSEYAGVKHGLIGSSPAMVKLRELIGLVAASDHTALILGEMGTGKESVARAIHRGSLRRDRPFVAVNCAAIPETLMENELFGHERGAFSGSVGKPGKIEIANGGTLFLDEIGDLKYSMQGALLRVLQEHEFERVGGTRTLKADVRIVAATNRDLRESIQKGTFRPDLYYRLNVVELRTPSLREIREDIPSLVEHFLQSERHIHVVKGVSPQAMAQILHYDWPGNVRELKNAIDRALLLRPPDFIEPQHLPALVQNGPAPNNDGSVLQQTEKAAIERVLRETRGNVTAAAAILGKSRRQLYRLIKRYAKKLP